MTDYYKNNKILMTAIAILFLFLIWELIAQLLKNPALPCPIPALTTFIQIFPLGLWKHFMISTYRVLTSILVGLALAVPLGLYIGRNTNIDKWLSPQLYLIYPIPKIALLPVIFAIFKIGDLSKIVLIVLIIFFQILITTRDAAKNIPENSILSVLSLGATPREIYSHVIIPKSAENPRLVNFRGCPNPLKFRFCLLFCLSCQITEFSINLIFFLKVTNYIWHFTHPLFKIFWPYDHQFFPCQAPAFHQPHSLPADRSFNQIANQTSISFIIIAFSFFFL
jgi:hypothetical protein